VALPVWVAFTSMERAAILEVRFFFFLFFMIVV
jgi:hypothetical protein